MEKEELERNSLLLLATIAELLDEDMQQGYHDTTESERKQNLELLKKVRTKLELKKEELEAKSLQKPCFTIGQVWETETGERILVCNKHDDGEFWCVVLQSNDVKHIGGGKWCSKSILARVLKKLSDDQSYDIKWQEHVKE